MFTKPGAPIPPIIIFLVTLLFGGLACTITDQLVTIVTATPASSPIPAPASSDATSLAPGGEAPTEALTTEASATIAHLTAPSEPGSDISTIDDRSSQTGQGVGAAQAESWLTNILERPFQRQSMIYQPFLDLDRAALSLNGDWLYASLAVHEAPPPDSPALYGIELDLDVDGRGDIWLAGQSPGSTQWATDGVQLRRDENGDVGGPSPSRADGPQAGGDGYETVEFDSGQGTDPDLAWARLDPSNPSVVQLALKRSALAGDEVFAWRPFTDGDLQDPGRFDYHDEFSLEQAGSPILDSGDYPLKELGSFDNSCAWAVGFIPTGSEPGMCLPPATPTPEATNTPQPGSIYGLVWRDFDLDGVKDSGEPPQTGLTMHLGAGACPASGYASTSTAYASYTENYRFSNLPPGTYCVSFNFEANITTNNLPATVQVSAGSETVVNFGLYYLSLE